VPYPEERIVCVKDNVLIPVALHFPFVVDKELYKSDRHDENAFCDQHFGKTIETLHLASHVCNEGFGSTYRSQEK
jgi:hypothetical protein